VWQSLVEELGVGQWDDAVVAAVDERDRCGDPRQQVGQHGKLLGVPADVAHRLDEAVAVVAVEVVRADVVGHPAGDRVHRHTDDRARIHPAVLVEVGVEHPRRQRIAEVEWHRRSARAHDHARDPLRMRGGREQRG
jgi:hypothetical protein